MNIFTAINDALPVSGVFRCSMDLREKFGNERVFTIPMSEQEISGFVIDYASTGCTSIAEIQSADYNFFQIVNEAAKFRYRSGNEFNRGKVTFRAPYELFWGMGTIQKKGLLLASIRNPNAILFLEPKALSLSGMSRLGQDYAVRYRCHSCRMGCTIESVPPMLEKFSEYAEDIGISCELISHGMRTRLGVRSARLVD
ncbi:unnamed protein product [Peronospora effusa]|nr:unnamed protein product [Peronospora effusa]